MLKQNKSIKKNGVNGRSKIEEVDGDTEKLRVLLLSLVEAAFQPDWSYTSH